MNKKGIFVPTLVFITVIVLSYAYFTLSSKEVESVREAVIGEVQTKMIKEYQQGEKVLLYIDKSVEYAAYKSVVELGENGGFHTDSPCGEVGEYEIWMIKGKCNPVGNLKGSFKNYFNKNLNDYLGAYPDMEIPTNNYGYTFEEINGDYLEITGLARGSITSKVENEFEIEYSVLPSFEQKIKYSLADYQRIINEIKKSDTQDCLKDLSTEDLKDCIWAAATEEIKEFEWVLEKDEDIIKFDVSKGYLFGPITIKFAINLENFKVEE